MCSLDQEYQLVNPTTQVALFSLCISSCISPLNITWIIYQGSMNATKNLVKWTQYTNISYQSDRRFFGNYYLNDNPKYLTQCF
jgi:hypothetical protein